MPRSMTVRRWWTKKQIEIIPGPGFTRDEDTLALLRFTAPSVSDGGFNMAATGGTWVHDPVACSMKRTGAGGDLAGTWSVPGGIGDAFTIEVFHNPGPSLNVAGMDWFYMHGDPLSRVKLRLTYSGPASRRQLIFQNAAGTNQVYGDPGITSGPTGTQVTAGTFKRNGDDTITVAVYTNGVLRGTNTFAAGIATQTPAPTSGWLGTGWLMGINCEVFALRVSKVARTAPEILGQAQACGVA